MRNILTSLLIAVFFSGCVHQINPLESNPIGKSYQGTINLRGMDIPLPEGEWNVVGRSINREGKFVEVILEQDVDNKPIAVVSIIRDTSDNSYKWYTRKELERKDMLHVVSNTNAKERPLDGWSINHIRYSAPGSKASEANKQAFQHIVDQKLVLPGNFIRIRHFFAGAVNTSKFLGYSLFLNPEAEGISPPTNSEWASSDWNIVKINGHPEKVEYIENLKKEGAVFHQKLRVAFGK